MLCYHYISCYKPQEQQTNYTQMNIYKELAEVAETKDDVKKMQDNILDLFHVDKEKATMLLNELNSIEEELEELDREIEQLVSQLV
jgi:hypothetical protein